MIAMKNNFYDSLTCTVYKTSKLKERLGFQVLIHLPPLGTGDVCFLTPVWLISLRVGFVSANPSLSPEGTHCKLIRTWMGVTCLLKLVQTEWRWVTQEDYLINNHTLQSKLNSRTSF
ncbi:hypothetical protein CDAR_621561 [Caerostris darwini]|uniref:Uncharacterized protein n=1 Tax=Caerostris darwini TaxID=1538125 RepID=A0AAV4P4N7_9ARAC|nr:hypothetical protein CDAR_621561 [Caerostris darwini]